MSVLPPDLRQKIPSSARKDSSCSNEAENSDERFRKLLKVSSVDEQPSKKSFFSIFEEEEIKVSSLPLPPPLWIQTQESVLASTALTSTILSVEIKALFEKMASCMIVMHSSQEMETTLFLDNPASIFCGTRITIQEFSTAPKTFNICIASTAQTIATIHAARQDLLAAFQNGKFNFSVHRLEMEIQPEKERPVLYRKESCDQEFQDQKKGRDE